MTFTSPWALVGFAVLPLLWWLHRRHTRPPAVPVPSLLFLDPEGEDEPTCRRRFDPELWLTMMAASLLALAAAGPVLRTRAAGRRVRVVVSAGAPAAARGYRDRVRERLAALEDALDPDDRLETVLEPPPGNDLAPRPDAHTLLALALAAPASTRLVLSDAPPPPEAAGVHWIQLGAPDAGNVGIVAADILPESGRTTIFAALQSVGQAGADLRIAAVGPDGGVLASEAVRLPADGHAGTTLQLPAGHPEFDLVLRASGGEAHRDDLAADDRVRCSWVALRHWLDPALPEAHRTAVTQALAAALGRVPPPTAAGPWDLQVVAADSDAPAAPGALRIVLHPLTPGGSETAAPTGTDRLRFDPLVEDLSTVGVDLRLAPSAVRLGGGAAWLLARRNGGRQVAIVVREGSAVHFLPDPLRGTPSPHRSILWPLFLDNALRVALGAPAEGAPAWRLRGVLDAATSRLGTRVSGDLRMALVGARRDRPPLDLALAPWLLLAGVLALLALWLLPWNRRPAPRPGDDRSPVPFPST